MAMYIIYFSPTGGTKRVANFFTNLQNDKKIEIDLSSVDITGDYSFKKEDVCLVAVPSFGGRVPKLAIDKLQHMKADHSKTILIAVYGNRNYDDTLLELKDTLQCRGFSCIAAVAAVAEHSIVHEIGTYRPDTQDEREFAEFSTKLQKLLKKENVPEVSLPGNYPYKEYHGVSLKPQSTKGCTLCGFCASQCPAQAIPKENPSSTNVEACISCMRCISICPEHARTLDPVLLSATSDKLKKICGQRKNNELFCFLK